MEINNEVKKLKLEELNRKTVSQYKNHEKIPLVVVLDNIRSMHNVGSIFRTSDAFSIQSIYLCGITPCPPHREIYKTALGATETVEWRYDNQITERLIQLKKLGYTIIGVEQTSKSKLIQDFLQDNFSLLKKQALVFGNEVEGLSDVALTHCDYFIEIPQDGTKHSLNVSVCAGIVLWEFFKQYASS